MPPGGSTVVLANIGLCAIVVAAWAELARHALRLPPRARAALLGAVMGIGAVAGMLVPYQVAPGVFFDLRTAMVALASFFGGPIAGAAAAAPALAYRAYLGAAGAVPGCLGVALAAALGCLGHGLRRGRAASVRHLAALGFGVAVANLLTPLLLPQAAWAAVLPGFGPVAFAAVLGAVVLVGVVLLTVQRREDLAATNALYRAMVEALPESLNVKDLEGRFLAANAATARSVGVAAPEHLIGKTDFDLHPAELARRYRADELAFLAGGGGPVVIDQPAGDSGWLSTVKAPFRDQRGRLAGIITLNRDITERKRNEVALAEARDAAAAARAKTDFLAVMSHEIRTPLTAVLGMADLLREQDLDARSRHYADSIRRSGRQLLAIVNDVLDFLRLGAGRLPLREVDFDLPALLEELRSTFHPLALEKGIELEVAAPLAGPAPTLAPPPLRGDPVRLRQVLSNFVGNAVKFTARGRVLVRTTLEEGQAGGAYRLRAEVEDSGPGIPADQLPRLFRAFTQVDGGAPRPVSGAGLGLAICKQLVEGMGGVIGCDSRPGVGSRFWFEVPLGKGSAVVEEAEAAEKRPLPPLDILVADDAPLNRELLADVLGGRGHRVALAGNGAELLEEAEGRLFDALIVDIQMPVMDGEEAVRRLRRGGGRNAGALVVALTANVVAEDRNRYVAGGFDAVLHKPIVWAELFAELERAARRGGRN